MRTTPLKMVRSRLTSGAIRTRVACRVTGLGLDAQDLDGHAYLRFVGLELILNQLVGSMPLFTTAEP